MICEHSLTCVHPPVTPHVGPPPPTGNTASQPEPPPPAPYTSRVPSWPSGRSHAAPAGCPGTVVAAAAIADVKMIVAAEVPCGVKETERAPCPLAMA